MNLRKKINNFLFRLEFSNVPTNFISKKGLFKLKFEPNWIYSKSGNSFYSFHNKKEDFKGGLQFSIKWNIQPPDGMNEKEAVIDLINREEGENVEYEEKGISNYKALHYSKNYDDSNMDFHNWIIYQNKVLVIIKFMIFEDEPDETKAGWLSRTKLILNSLELDEVRFQTTRMK